MALVVREVEDSATQAGAVPAGERRKKLHGASAFLNPQPMLLIVRRRFRTKFVDLTECTLEEVPTGEVSESVGVELPGHGVVEDCSDNGARHA
jgi:hypothetical protein